MVGNPCNTNALIALSNAPEIPTDRFFAMTRLDENRAKTQLALKANVPVAKVDRLAIWGNHSATMVPDFYNARISGKPVDKVISDEAYLKGDFFTTIQQRGAAIIKARGLSSAASAANAAVDTVRSLVTPTPCGDWHSVGVYSDGSYGLPKGIVTSFPIRSNGTDWEIVQGLKINPFIKEKIDLSIKELLEEKELVKDLAPDRK